MPKIQIISVGRSDEPSIPTATAFFDVVNQIETFQEEQTERLCYEHYETLSETATVMRTLGNVLCNDGQNDYLISRLRDAQIELAFYRKLIQQEN